LKSDQNKRKRQWDQEKQWKSEQIDEKNDGKVKRQWDQEKQLKSDQNRRKKR